MKTHGRIAQLLDRTSVFDDSAEVADGLVSRGDLGYWIPEAQVHILGLWAHTQQLHRELEKLVKAQEKPC
jgi:hypothetical protein